MYAAILFGKPEKTKTADTMKCERCKSNDLSSHEIATRSADEPVTIFIKCKKCLFVKCER